MRRPDCRHHPHVIVATLLQEEKETEVGEELQLLVLAADYEQSHHSCHLVPGNCLNEGGIQDEYKYDRVLLWLITVDYYMCSSNFQ